MQWYYIDAQQNYVGPVDAGGLEQLRVHGYVQNDTFVWAECLSGWQRLSSVAILNGGAAPPVAPGASTAAPTAPAPPAAPVAPEHPVSYFPPSDRPVAASG